jgi:hypothetical protein
MLNKRFMLPILTIGLSGISLGWCIYAIISFQIFDKMPSWALSEITIWGAGGVLFILLTWLTYSWLLSNIIRVPFSEINRPDLYTYIPFIFLLAVLFVPYIDRFYVRPLFQVLLGFSALGFIIIKSINLLRILEINNRLTGAFIYWLSTRSSAHVFIGICGFAFVFKLYAWYTAYGFPDGDAFEYADRVYYSLHNEDWIIGRHDRPLLFVYLLAIPLYLIQLFNVDSPDILTQAMQTVPFVFSFVVLAATYYVGYQINPSIGLLSAALLAINPFFTWYATLTSTEMVMTAFIAVSYMLLLKKPTWKWMFTAGLVLGLGMWVNHITGLFTLPIGLWLLFQRRFAHLFGFTGGFILAALWCGLADYMVYGQFWGSLWHRYFVMVDQGAAYKLHPMLIFPFYYYFEMILFWMPPIETMFLLIGFILLIRHRRHRQKIPGLIWLTLIIFFTFYSLVGWKVLRYLVPAFPFLAIAAATGLDAIVNRWVLPSLPSANQLAKGLLLTIVCSVMALFNIANFSTSAFSYSGDYLTGVKEAARTQDKAKLLITNPFLVPSYYATNGMTMRSFFPGNMDVTDISDRLHRNDFILTDGNLLGKYPKLHQLITDEYSLLATYSSGVVLWQKGNR